MEYRLLGRAGLRVSALSLDAVKSLTPEVRVRIEKILENNPAPPEDYRNE